MKQKIAIIGGSYLQLPLVLKCKEMGIESHCFAWADGAVCDGYADYFYPISIIEKEQILNKCKEIGIDAIASIASDVAVITVNYIADKMGLVANSVEYTDITTNKYKMRQALSSEGIPCPLFKLVADRELPDISKMTFPLIVKPTDRSGSRGVKKILKADELRNAIDRAAGESFKNEVIIEEYVEGREISVESISFDGQHHILQITDKVTTGAPYFVELEHHQPSTLPDEIKEQVKTIVLQALDALRIRNGASHSEMKITPDGDIKVIEIGARMGGDFIGSDLVKLSTGYDFVKGVVEVALGIFKEPEFTEQKFSGVYFLSKETEHLQKYVDNWKNYPQIVRGERTDNELHEIHESADRSGYFIYQSDHKFNCDCPV